MNVESIQPKHRAVILLVVQAAVVLSIAGKYLYERHTCPRVWVRTAQYDPNLPLRGRYLGLSLVVDSCSLPPDTTNYYGPAASYASPQRRAMRWRVRPAVQNGKLIAVPASYADRPDQTQELNLWPNRNCDRAVLADPVDYYIPDTAKTPFPLQHGQELWVEVTVPPQGPPRPIQLALSQNGTWQPLKLE